MRNKTPYIIAVLIALVCLIACDTEPVERITYDTTLDKGDITFYGQYYAEEGVEKNIFELDVYSPSITIDKNGYITGQGTNVYISDLFTDTTHHILPDGDYHSDKTADSHTFLPGIEVEGQYSGAYILQLQESGKYQVFLVDTGTVAISHKEDSTIIDFNLRLADRDKTIYIGQYRGIIPYRDGRPKKNTKRLSHLSEVGKIAVSELY